MVGRNGNSRNGVWRAVKGQNEARISDLKNVDVSDLTVA